MVSPSTLQALPLDDNIVPPLQSSGHKSSGVSVSVPAKTPPVLKPGEMPDYYRPPNEEDMYVPPGRNYFDREELNPAEDDIKVGPPIL